MVEDLKLLKSHNLSKEVKTAEIRIMAKLKILENRNVFDSTRSYWQNFDLEIKREEKRNI